MIHSINNRQLYTAQKYRISYFIETASFEITSLFDYTTFQTKIKFSCAG